MRKTRGPFLQLQLPRVGGGAPQINMEDVAEAPTNPLTERDRALPADASVEEDSLLEIMWAVHDALEDEGCQCNGAHLEVEARQSALATNPSADVTAIKKQRDEYWGADIAELVLRSLPHVIYNEKGEDVTVSVKLETLRAEVDDFGEICCWVYEES